MTDTTDTPLALSSRFLSALNYATSLHARQYRKGPKIPYISHLYSVAALVMEAGGTEVEVTAALLHDAVEDQGGAPILELIRDQFGDQVADIVKGCTDEIPEVGKPKKPWQQRKEAYIAHLDSASHSVRLVSNADKLHNARCILRDYKELEEALWERFSASRDDILWYYRALADVFLRKSASSWLAIELDDTVSLLESLHQDTPITGLARQSEEYIEALVALAEAEQEKSQASRKQNEAGYGLLELFCEAVREGETPHRLLTHYVAGRMASIYHGLDIDVKGGEESIKIEPPGAGYFNLYGAGDEDQQTNLKADVARRDWKADPRRVFPKIPPYWAAPEHLRWALAVERLKASGDKEVVAIRKVMNDVKRSEGSVVKAHQTYRKYAQHRVRRDKN